MNKKIGVLIVGIILVVGGVFLLNNIGKETKPDLEYSKVELTAENKLVRPPFSLGFEENKFYTGKIKVSFDIINPRDTKAAENIELLIDDSPFEGDNGELRDNKSVELEAGQTKTINFVILENDEGNYIARIDGLSKSFQVVDPTSNPVLYPEHYYAVAKDYISREYEMPENKDIKGLVDFLNQIEMPPYSSDSFKCTDSSVMLEWLLEGAGFNADIVVDLPENKKEGKYSPQKWEVGHSWIMVYLENREIAIESEFLGSSGRVAEEVHFWYYTYTTVPYEPPGIIETQDNYLRNNSIRLPDITASYAPYYYDNIDNRYASPKELQKALEYVKEKDYNWWSKAINHPGIKSAIYDVEPFSEWVRK